MKAVRLPSGNYRVMAYVGKDADGKQIRKSFTDPDKRTALMLASEFVAQHRDSSTAATFGAASEAFLRTAEKEKSPSTCRGYVSINNRLRDGFPAFYSIKCNNIAERDVRHVIDALRSEGRSPKTITNYYFYITAVCNSKRIRLDYADLLPQKKRPELHIPTSDQVRAILAEAKRRDVELWICLSLAALGPLRASEISALQYRYCDLDFAQNTVHVTHALVYNADQELVLKEPKTPSSNRIITMPAEIMEAIHSRGYVTTYPPRLIYSKFKKIIRDLGMPGIRLHDLRHYCASMLHAKGYPDAYIQARTGHSGLEVLRMVYTHALDDERRRMEQKMLSDFEQLL